MIAGLIFVGIAGLGFMASTKNNDVKLSEDKFSQYDSIFKTMGAKYNVDWKKLKRISWIESKVGTYRSVAIGIKNPNDIKGSISEDGLSWGIMQVTLKTARDYDKNVTAQKLNNVSYSIELAAKHFVMLQKLFPNERDQVMSYNHGQGNQKNFLLKEKNRTLLDREYQDGRNYFAEYKKAKEILG
jgi:soluble lytic murein transglycosylase-like protein